MTGFFAILSFCAFYLLLFGLVSRLLKEKLYISEPLVSFLYGILICQNFLGLINPSYFESKEVLYYMSSTILCFQTMTAAMSLPHGYILREVKSLFILVVVVGFIKYIFTFILIYIFTHYNAVVSFGIAACLTPTDPVLSSSIIKSRFADKYIPERLRFLLTAESGINDGFGLFLLFIPIDLFYGRTFINSVSDLVLSTILYKTIFPALIGIIIGYCARKLLFSCYSCNMVGSESFMFYGITLLFFVLGLMESIQMSALVALFFTGTAFSWDEWFVFETRESKLQEVIDSLLTCSFFMFFGTIVDLETINFKLAVCTIIIIFTRRIMACLLVYKFIDAIKSKEEAIFIGWFGPIGVGALYYSLFLDRMLGIVTINTVSFVVMISIMIHGLSIPLMNSLKDRINYESFNLNKQEDNLHNLCE